MPNLTISLVMYTIYKLSTVLSFIEVVKKKKKKKYRIHLRHHRKWYYKNDGLGYLANLLPPSSEERGTKPKPQNRMKKRNLPPGHQTPNGTLVSQFVRRSEFEDQNSVQNRLSPLPNKLTFLN
jgi:hypothetical protein